MIRGVKLAFDNLPAVHQLTQIRVRRSFKQFTLQKDEDIANLVDYTFKFNVAGVKIAPFQVSSELEAFLKRVRETNPKTILEIGTAPLMVEHYFSFAKLQMRMQR